MPIYLYKARDETGKMVKGTMDAVSREELINKLNKMGYMATYVAETHPGVRIESILDRLKKIGSEEMIMFYVQFSNMINAGVTILTSLDTMAKQVENKRLREVVGGVARGIEAGDSFSKGISRYPKIFPPLLVSMARVGEASGKLDTVLSRYAEFTEQELDLRQKIRGALFYPIILLFAGVGVTLFIVTFVIPQFSEIFMKAGITLPGPTLVLYKIGTWIKEYWYAVGLSIIAAGLGVNYYAGTRKGRPIVDRFKLNLPIVGTLYRKAAISRFARTLGTLVRSGVPILESLSITKEVIQNEVLAHVIGNVEAAVEKGEGIAGSLKISKDFPPDCVQMISVGEESGKLDEMLDKISDFYDRALGYTIKKLTTIIEPLFIVIMGCMVGFIMLSLLLPIFDMIKVLRR